MRLTVRGVAFVAGGVSALALGVAGGTLAPGALGLVLLLAIAHAAVAGGAPGITVARRVDRRTSREGVAVEVSLTVHFEDDAPRAGFLEVEDALPAGLAVVEGRSRKRLRASAAGARLHLPYAVEGRAPGRFRVGPTRLRFTDPLGLVEHTTTARDTTSLTVYPRTETLDTTPTSSRLALILSGEYKVGQGGSGSDFFALRGFQEGDTLRDVNWKASARTGMRDLVVNQRERETHAHVTFLVDGRRIVRVGTRGVNGHVLAIRAVAHLAHRAAAQRDRSRLILYGDQDVRVHTAAAQDALLTGLLDPMLDHTPAGTRGLRDAVDDAVAHLPRKSPVVVVSPLLDDPDVDAAVHALRALGMRVLVVAIQGPRLLELAGDPPEAVEEAWRRHHRLVAVLRAQGARVLDWNPDDAFPLAVLQEAQR